METRKKERKEECGREAEATRCVAYGVEVLSSGKRRKAHACKSKKHPGFPFFSSVAALLQPQPDEAGCKENC